LSFAKILMTSFCTGHHPTKYDRNYITLVERLLYKNEELKKLYFMDFWSVTVAIKINRKPKTTTMTLIF